MSRKSLLPQFRIEHGAISLHFPAGYLHIHIRQGDEGTADVVITDGAETTHSILTANELIDALRLVKDKDNGN